MEKFFLLPKMYNDLLGGLKEILSINYFNRWLKSGCVGNKKTDTCFFFLTLWFLWFKLRILTNGFLLRNSSLKALLFIIYLIASRRAGRLSDCCSWSASHVGCAAGSAECHRRGCSSARADPTESSADCSCLRATSSRTCRSLYHVNILRFSKLLNQNN